MSDASLANLTENRRDIPLSAWVFLFVGILAVSTAAVLIRLAQAEGVPSLVIAALRLSISALILTPLALARHYPAIKALRLRDWMLLTLSGVFLALHFASWITSLELTTVLISTVLVTTTPIWVSALEVLFLRARLSKWVILGLCECIAGGLAIGIAGASGDGVGSDPLLGGTLALIGAMTVAVYMVIGRSVRPRLALLPYIWVVYSIAAITLVILALLSGHSFTGYSASAYGYVLLTALIPQLIGHSSFNYAVKYLPATYIGIITQLEPLASAVLAFFLLSELPTPVQIVASGLILFGVANVVLSPPLAPRANRQSTVS
jgi:drug/metabolite transporter (DMT)-like permease